MNKRETEKSLKRFLKRKISYSFALLITFIISGEISLASETMNAVQNKEITEKKLSEAEDLVSLFKMMKNKTVVQKSQGKSTQFFFNVWLEKRKAKKYADNGFKEWAEDSINPENPDTDIEIPDIVSPIRPDIKDPEGAIPNEDALEEEPKFEFKPVGDIAMGEAPQDITINVAPPKIPVSEITDGDFNIFDKDSISAPENIENIGNVTVPDLATGPNVVPPTPNADYSGNITTFTPPEIPKVQVGEINVPGSFSIDAVNITIGSVNQDVNTDYAKTATNYVVKNYTDYKADNRGFNIWFNAGGIYYDDENTRGDKTLTLNKNTILQKNKGNDHYVGNYDNSMTTNYISDVIGKDVSVEGPFNLTYQGNRAAGTTEVTPYVRTFLTSSSKGLKENGSENIKITKFAGDLNLATTNETNQGNYEDLKGNLIGMEHQLWNTEEKSSVLINSGNINIGKRIDPYDGNKNPGGTEITTNIVNKNMIGIMIDYAGNTNQNKKTKNKTINAGTISIEKPKKYDDKQDANILDPSNNIGISFEEVSSSNVSEAVLNDEVYIGKINIGDNTKNNYGFRMGNIYNSSANYFDETKIIGNVDGNKITVENDNSQNNIVLDYTSKIDVKGTENIGMVVGKSLSSTKNVNPIANFVNISIEVNGKNNIGFLRDKNYSDNNKNDMVINDSNFKELSFGKSAANSVLIRSEQYGIKLGKNLDVSSGKAENGEYNVALQATRQTWNDGAKDINSAGSVENSETLSGTTDRMAGVMSSGTLTNGVNNWQNGDNNGGKALAKNSGTISLTGKNNIGMAVLDGNSGENKKTGTISITGDDGVGIYNIGGDITADGTINITGNNSVGIYSTGEKGELNLSGLEINLKNSDTTTLADTGTTGIYISKGKVNFGTTADTKTSVTGESNSQAGLYATGDVTVSGYADISGTKVGVVSAAVETNGTKTTGNITVDNGHISYDGGGYALYTDRESKITLGNNSSLTLGGNAYGMNIDTSRINDKKAIDFGGAAINIKSNNVTIFNIVDKEGDYTLESGNGKLPGADSLSQYVGNIGSINSNGNEGYKIASVDGGIINLNSSNGNNEKFLEKYKFQKSKVNVATDTKLSLTNDEANTYFDGEVIGIGQSSSQNIKTGEGITGEAQRAETTITINKGATVTADRTEEAENDGKSTVGAYIDYGVISLENGKIVVEDDGTDTANKINNDGIGIYAKNGSKITTDNNSSITVNGNNGVGIFAEATEEETEEGKNKFGGNITTLEISNGGNITLNGKGGIGIFADNEVGTEKANVSNTGTITVGDSDLTDPNKLNTSVGIYGDNTNISNQGKITVGKSGAGIYADNSVVENIGSISLGKDAVGVYVNGESSVTNTADVKFTENNNVEGSTGIYFAGSTDANKNAEISFSIDMSEVDNGRAIVSDGRDITLNKDKTITVSGNGGRGIRVVNAKAVNNGKIVINETQGSGTAVGLLAADTNGTLNNSGTITVKGQKGIGIYAENNGADKTGNSIENIGIINLGADKAIGVAAKNIDITINSTDNISFADNGKNATNSIGIYAENGTVTNKKSDFTVTGNGDFGKKNIGIYLKDKASYTENGSIKVENGAVGIYADKGVSSLTDLDITSDSKGVQTIGVALNGADKEIKTISGKIDLTNTTTEATEVGGKNIGVYAQKSTVNVKEGETLTLNYNESNGTGIYLNDSALSGSGTIKITGTPNSLKTSNSIGIYYSGNSNSAEHQVKLEIDKSNTIGVFASGDSSFVRGADINIGTDNSKAIEKVTGITVSDGAEATNKGTITLGNVSKGTGMAAVQGTNADKIAELTNSGNIVISEKAVSGTGVFLSGNSQFTGADGTITIKGEAKDDHLGIGIYALGEKAVVNSTGKFDMAEGNVAVYSEGADISSDINLNTDGKNKGTTALVIKSDTNGTTVGGKADKMQITLAENSTGIYALDSGVKIENVSIDASANTGINEKDKRSYGIYLGEDSGKTYSINNTDVNIVKGLGIVLSSSENAKTSLNLTGSTVKVNSYSEGAEGTGTDSAETGIGIYGEKDSTITLSGGNKLDVSYGTGIYSENGTIFVGTGTGIDTINLQGYSVGLYSKGGDIILGNKTAVAFEKMADSVVEEDNVITKGAAAYAVDGSIRSSANITGDESADLNGFIALLGKDSIIENSGNITLTGEAVSGITAQGGSVINKKTITVGDNDSSEGNHVSTGIYSEGAFVDNTAGTIIVNGASAGIAYTGTNEEAIINAGNIIVNGKLNIGVSLNGNAKDVTVGTIKGGTDNSSNLGVYINQFTGNIEKIGNITLGDTSLGVYADSTTNTIESLGQITVGKEGIGVAVTNGGDLTIKEKNFTITAGDGGTGVYVENSDLKVSSLKDVEVGTKGAMVHVNGGTLTLETTAGDVKLDNRIGIVLQNGGNITSSDGSKISNMTVTNGGIGIVVKDGNSHRPNIFGDNTTITLGDGNRDKELYSVGIYYQNAKDIGTIEKADVKYENGASHTIGTIFDNTYGTLTNSHIAVDNSINNSIGIMAKKGGAEAEGVDKLTFNAGTDNKLINVDGDYNIGILGQDFVIDTKGDIVVGSNPDSNNSVGVYLIGKDGSLESGYTGVGNITVGSSSQGIYAKNYDVSQTGNLTITDGVGIAGIITDDYTGSSKAINLTGDITIKGDAEGNTVGIYGKGTDITAEGNMNISGVNNIGIFSSEKGNISFTGKTIEINGAGSIGIYKDTEETKGQFEDTKINVSKGEWNLGDKTIGIAARGEGNDNITITNSANMTLGAGAMGIYSVGKNTVINSGAINVGAGIQGTETDTASIGIYMANRFGGAYAIGTNTGKITADENGAVGVQAAGYAQITNEENGVINVSNSGTGMISTLGAKVINKGDITVTDSGAGMVADGISSAGKESEAINYGNITLNKTDKYNPDDSMIGMGAYNGGKITNAQGGTITVNAGTGMYFDKKSSFENSGKIILNDGVGIMGTGVTVNNGGTIIVNGGTATVDPDNTAENSHTGSIVADNINKVVYVNDNFINVGGILETDFDIKLNNPTVDITAGGAGFDGKDISGEISLDSKFALTGNGISYSVEDFVKPDSDVTVNTSPLFVSSLDDGKLTVNKVDYKDITAGDQFDIRDNALDSILAQGGKDTESLKKLNYYLNSIKDISVFNSETERTMGEIGGNIYANVQSRMQDINRAFDNSVDEMISSHNPAPVNDKFSMIYTNGKYENSNTQLIDYDYSITGLNYMREYEENNLNRKYGFNLGFAVSKFDFDDSGSEEDVYSLRTGVHHVKWFENGISLTSKAEIGYNRHSTDRKIDLGIEKHDADSDFNSYHVSLDNKVRKVIFKGENTEVGAYTGLNLEYGRFDKIKENDFADLKVKAGDYMSSKAFVGVDAQNTQYLPNDWAVKFKGDIQYSYDFGKNYDENRANINNSSGYYSLMNEMETKGAVSGKAGVSFEKSDYMSVSLEGDYIKDFERDEDYWRAGLRFTYKFNSEDAVAVLKNPSIFLESYFDFDSDKLKSEDVQTIRKTSEMINQNKTQGTLIIEGHTDNTGTEKYNQLLSEKRAASVKNEFKKNLKENSNIEYDVKGYGETQPVAENTTSQGRAKNRRVDVKLINR